MKFSRDTWLALGLFLLLALVTIVVGIQSSNKDVTSFLSTSPAPYGTLALKLWMNELGIQTIDESPTNFELPKNADIIFIIQPIIGITESEWKRLDEWVDDGGTLVLAGSNFSSLEGFRHYSFDSSLLDAPAETLSVQTPLLSSPQLTTPIPVKADFGLRSDEADFVTHLSVKNEAVLVSFEQKQGRVILSTAAYPFSNLGLKDEANAKLVLNLIALSARKTRTAWLDDWHHGIQGNDIIGPDQWLRGTPGGHAILFILGAIFLGLLLRGRAFGRPVPLPSEIKRRGPLEHVTAIANLNRKAGHREAVLGQYHHRLKRHLGRRYRIDPSLPDKEYLETLAKFNPELNTAALFDLLKRLKQKNIGEHEAVKLSAEASKWLNNE
jgi:hypothetical protein